LDQRVEHYDQQIEMIAKSDEQAQRLMTIPGIAAKGATALLAAIGDISHFKNGRELAAWLGLVPRQHSTGGKSTLLGISRCLSEAITDSWSKGGYALHRKEE